MTGKFFSRFYFPTNRQLVHFPNHPKCIFLLLCLYQKCRLHLEMDLSLFDHFEAPATSSVSNASNLVSKRKVESVASEPAKKTKLEDAMESIEKKLSGSIIEKVLS